MSDALPFAFSLFVEEEEEEEEEEGEEEVGTIASKESVP